MAGTPHGLLDCRFNSGGQDTFENFMYILYRFFKTLLADTYGYTTLVASNYGSAGSGFGYAGSGSEPGNNAWFVVKFNTSVARPGGGSQLGEYYVLVQGTGNVGFGSSPGSPGRCAGSTATYRVGLAVAFRTDGGNPWGGTTGSPGSDTKGSPVWTAGGSTLCVMDVANLEGYGTYGTNKENCIQIDSFSTTAITHRAQLFADEDNFSIFWDYGETEQHDNHITCNLYTPFDGFTVSYPLLVTGCGSLTYIPWGTSTYGTQDGTDTYYQGGVVGSDDFGPLVGGASMRALGTITGSTSWSPNRYYLPELRWDESPYFVHMVDYLNSFYHAIGVNDQWGPVVYNFPHRAISADGTKTALTANGGTSQAQYRIVMPIGGTPLLPIGTGFTVGGRAF